MSSSSQSALDKFKAILHDDEKRTHMIAIVGLVAVGITVLVAALAFRSHGYGSHLTDARKVLVNGTIVEVTPLFASGKDGECETRGPGTGVTHALLSDGRYTTESSHDGVYLNHAGARVIGCVQSMKDLIEAVAEFEGTPCTESGTATCSHVPILPSCCCRCNESDNAVGQIGCNCTLSLCPAGCGVSYKGALHALYLHTTTRFVVPDDPDLPLLAVNTDGLEDEIGDGLASAPLHSSTVCTTGQHGARVIRMVDVDSDLHLNLSIAINEATRSHVWAAVFGTSEVPRRLAHLSAWDRKTAACRSIRRYVCLYDVLRGYFPALSYRDSEGDLKPLCPVDGERKDGGFVPFE